MADLLSIKKGLKKEKGNEHHVQRLDQAIERGTYAFRSAAAPEGVEARLKRIEAMLEATQKPCAAHTRGKGKS
jgi:Arc/MetJ-type ribon-helix-helix transcriptional regulator